MFVDFVLPQVHQPGRVAAARVGGGGGEDEGERAAAGDISQSDALVTPSLCVTTTQRVRDAKLEEERALQAERIERSVERAQASTTKKIGKPVMFRAPPVRKQKVAEAVQVTFDVTCDVRCVTFDV